jgi:hypothetical protein
MTLYRATYRGVLGSFEVYAHTMHFEDDTSTGPGDVIAAAKTWGSNIWTTTLKTYYKLDVGLASIRLQQLNPLTGAQLDAMEDVYSGVGGSDTTGIQLPYEVSPAVSWRTATSTRSGRGRFYMPSPSTTACASGGIFSTAFCSALSGGVQNACDIFCTSTRRIVIASKVGGPPWVLRTVTRYDVGNVPDVQRRRRNKQVETRVGNPIVF